MRFFFVLALLFVVPALAEPMSPTAIQVTDGDTIRVAGTVFRLVGLDAPETYRAKCSSERDLGNRATFRLRQLIAGGGIDLEAVPCSCRAGTEGTMACNFGRACGVLRIRGRDAAEILIGEGLARSHVCGRSKCPSRGGWCG